MEVRTSNRSKSARSAPQRILANSSRRCGVHRIYRIRFWSLPRQPCFRQSKSIASTSPRRWWSSSSSANRSAFFPNRKALQLRLTIWPRQRRRRRRRCGRLGQSFRPPRFWDTLSRVRLSRGAIREFDRRTSQTGRRQQLSRPSRLLPFPAGNLQQLRRFSRHGGPDLAHLRGVSVLSNE
jgi:hypothetical protein